MMQIPPMIWTANNPKSSIKSSITTKKARKMGFFICLLIKLSGVRIPDASLFYSNPNTVQVAEKPVKSRLDGDFCVSYSVAPPIFSIVFDVRVKMSELVSKIRWNRNNDGKGENVVNRGNFKFTVVTLNH